MGELRKGALFNYEAEQAVLGCIMISQEAAEYIFANLEAENFYSPNNQIIFTNMKIIHDKGEPVDLITLHQQLESTGLTDKCGGFQYITGLSDIVPSASNHGHYSGIVKDLSNKRALTKFGHAVVKKSGGDTHSNGLVDEYMSALERFSEDNVKSEIEDAHTSSEKEFKRIVNASEGKFDAFGLKTGFNILDNSLWGLKGGEVFVVSARPGVGKSAFALNILHHASILNKKPGIMFNLEMPNKQTMRRLYSIDTGIANQELLRGTAYKTVPDLINRARERMTNGKLFLDDSCESIAQMLFRCKQIKRKYGLSLVVIDYLQLVKPSKPYARRDLEVAEISKSIKSMSRVLDVPIIVLAQPSRALDKDKDGIQKDPTMSDLKESGAIESDADMVAFLIPKSDIELGDRVIIFRLVKNRHGACFSVLYQFIGSNFTFKEIDKVIKVKKASHKNEQLNILNDELSF